jgi:FkbM family methyltransferase
MIKDILKVLYKNIPCKRSFFTLLKRVYSPPTFISQYLKFDGEFEVIDQGYHFKMVNFSNPLETSLFWGGLDGFEKDSLSLWVRLSKTALGILDIGAYTGYYSILAKLTNPKSTVLAFEPVKRRFDRLVHNCENNTCSVECFNIALSDKDGPVILYDLPMEHHNLATLDGSAARPFSEKRIPTKILAKTLDTLADEQDIQRIDLIKIDLEGFEPNILFGAKRVIHKWKPSMIVEILDEPHAAAIEELLINDNYYYFDLDEKTGPKKIGSLQKSSFHNIFICQASVAKTLGLV